jgi:hypothetical protein
MESHVFQGPNREPLDEVMGGYRDLPTVLRAYADRLRELLNIAGKPRSQIENLCESPSRPGFRICETEDRNS